jgi:hypothetical protein
VSFSKVVIDGGKKAVAVGSTKTVHVPYTFTLTADPGVDITQTGQFYPAVDIYQGQALESDRDLSGDLPATCKITTPGVPANGSTAATPTIASCKGTIDIHPDYDLFNSWAGSGWKGVAYAFDLNGVDPSSPDPDLSKVGMAYQDGLHAPAVQRYSKLTVNASPEPVRKNHSVTVTGTLTRANWDTNEYAGYTKQKVALQFRKKGGSTYKTVKTVTTDSHGKLKTTYKATTSGYWRYSFAGTSTTPAVNATGDYVKVS